MSEPALPPAPASVPVGGRALRDAPAEPGRLVSLDAFRGIAIAAMILVNNPGDWDRMYVPLQHADWHGWTPTDLIFPFFVFIVGVAIVVAKPKPTLTIVRRGAVLWLLGLFMAGYPFFTLTPPFGLREGLARIRILGVLPRLGICYVAAALLYRWLRPRALAWLVAVLLAGYWLALAGAGHLDSKSENLAARVDRAVLGAHMWRTAYDPEGILSTVPALCTALFGVFAGLVLKSARAPEQKTLGLFLAGAPLVVAGHVWGWFFPINKALWTSSYAVLTAGQAMCALALCHWLCDVRGRRAWCRPFVIYGVNAITVFVGSGLLARTLSLITLAGSGGRTLTLRAWLHEHLFASWLAPIDASLGFALAWVAAWFFVLRWMWRRGIVLRV